MKLKAFTLIELLVVISIIAILAAILFPVFAVAKAAAKKTTSLENLHQIHLSLAMYQGDSDDMGTLNFASSNTASYTWQDLIQPYAKSYGIVFDPLSLFQNQDHANTIDYWMSYGMLPEATALLDGSLPNYTTRFATWLQAYTPGGVNYDGIAGTSIDQFGWNAGGYNTVAGGVASKSPDSIARPAEYAYVFTAGNWDGYHAVYAMPSGFGYCGGWGGSIQDSFLGFQPRYNGGPAGCDVSTRQEEYGKGIALVLFADGHSKGWDSRKLLSPDPNGGNFLTYWWPNQ